MVETGSNESEPQQHTMSLMIDFPMSQQNEIKREDVDTKVQAFKHEITVEFEKKIDTLSKRIEALSNFKSQVSIMLSDMSDKSAEIKELTTQFAATEDEKIKGCPVLSLGQEFYFKLISVQPDAFISGLDQEIHNLKNTITDFERERDKKIEAASRFLTRMISEFQGFQPSQRMSGSSQVEERTLHAFGNLVPQKDWYEYKWKKPESSKNATLQRITYSMCPKHSQVAFASVQMHFSDGTDSPLMITPDADANKARKLRTAGVSRRVRIIRGTRPATTDKDNYCVRRIAFYDDSKKKITEFAVEEVSGAQQLDEELAPGEFIVGMFGNYDKCCIHNIGFIVSKTSNN